MGTTNTQIWTSNGFGGYTQPQFFQNTTEVAISDPLTGQPTAYPYSEVTFQEDNPFNLEILSFGSNDILAPAGGISLASAGVADNGLFLQYWDIDIVSNRGGIVEFQGVLQRDGLAEALAINNLNVPGDNITSFAGISHLQPVSVGTEINGSFDPSSGEFTAAVEGFTVRGDYFYTEVYDYYNFV